MDLIIHNVAIGACEKATTWSFALHLLAVGLGFEDFQADVVSFTTTMNALGKGSEWQQSINLLDDLDDGTMATVSIQPNLMTWNSCVSTTGRAFEWQQGLAMLEASQCCILESQQPT